MATTKPPKVSAPADETAPAGNTVNKAAQGAREIVDKVAGMADETVRKAIPAAQQLAHKAVDKVEANVAPAAAWLEEHADDLNVAQEKILADTRNYIRENPLKSIGIAVAVGLLIGRIVR
jgi:ElaB/YqjD/DUF883 family membrane-anchored ribosome-binding protein